VPNEDYSCFECVEKHLCQAMQNYAETRLGHPEKRFDVIGNLAEAEKEVYEKHLDFALAIRNHRRRFRADIRNKPSFMGLLTFNETLTALPENATFPAVPEELIVPAID